MAAPILLSEYKMKKKKAPEPKSESEAPVTLGFMREFRAEIMSKFSEIDTRFKQVDSRFDSMEARFNGRLGAMDAKIDRAVAEMKTMNHQTKLLVEEQDVRNKQAYDGYALTYGAVQDLKKRIKSECLEE